MAHTPHAAVLLAGCGHLDGAEIREAVLTLLALDQHGATWQCLAPDAPQHHVIDHRTGEPVPGETRNILAESSRIARVGQCLDLAQARVEDYDCLLIPGGYGVAKNHCTFAFDGPAGSVREDVAAFLKAFLAAGKPVGAICVSPALVAMVLGAEGKRAKLTLGNGDGPTGALEVLGQEAVRTPSAREIVVDPELNLVTTPAYMFDEARLSEVFTGIERCVAEVLLRV